MTTTEPLTYTVAEAAPKLRVSQDMIYQRVKEREWPCTRLGRKIHFTPAQIQEILAICSQPALTRTPRRRAG
jgi:excisionase family DNA binding protein